MPTPFEKFINKTGLTYFMDRLKTIFAAKAVVAESLDTKVDKVVGKTLSTNDYSNLEKDKLDGISSGAQVNIVEEIQKNGAPLTPTNKVINISVPTTTSQLTNDSTFQTKNQIETLISNAVSGVVSFEVLEVNTLPVTGVKGIIYLLPDGSEWIWIPPESSETGSGHYRDLNTVVDLSDYYSIENLTPITAAEIDEITAM